MNILNSKDDSYYYAFISVKNKNGNGYRYKYIKFKPDEESKSGAEDDMLYTYTETSSESDNINLFLLAQIPNTEMALQKVRSWFNTGTTEPSNNSENRLLMNSSQACSYEDGRICFSTGDPDMPHSCWHYAIESCPSEELEEEDGSGVGGSYEPDCYGWDCEPIDPTGGGGGSSSDPDPNDDPSDTECTGDSEDINQLPQDSDCNNEEACPLGQIDDGFGNCIEEEVDPCEGNNPPDYCYEPDLCIGDPLPNPEITPSNGWNVKGGMFGPTRNCDSNGLNCDLHDGIDISAELNSPLFSMHPGTVVEKRNPPMDPGEYDGITRTWGNYVIIESVINGEIVRFRYAHLNEMHVPVGATIYAGQQIGLTGNTGNAQSTRRIKVLPHVHVQSWKVVNGQKIKVDPNDYMSTKFNNNGTVNSSASSCEQ